MSESPTPTPPSPPLPALEVPPRWRALVYVIGMLGFPIVIALYVLVVLSADLKQVNDNLTGLATRIDERPMGIEKSTDFVIYLTDALRADIQAGFLNFTDSLALSSLPDSRSTTRTLTIVRRELNNYIRPIVRKHERFAARFPTEGGNLGALFRLSSVGEDVDEGETEAHLATTSSARFSEALAAMIMNNFANFGQIDAALVNSIVDDPVGSADKYDAPPGSGAKSDSFDLIDKKLFYDLSMSSIETATIVLRDQMLETIRLNSTELED